VKYLFLACLRGAIPIYDYAIASQTQSIKSREQQSSLEQQQQHVHAQQSPQQIHMHQLLLQRQQQEQQQQQHQQQHPQQQRRHQKQQQRNDSNYLPASPQNGSVSADPPPQLNTVATNSSSPKIYEERMKIPVQSDTLDEASIKVFPQWQFVLLLKPPSNMIDICDMH
jgi:hypothetical protein